MRRRDSSTPTEPPSRSELPRESRVSGFSLGSIGGVRIVIDWSLALIFTLILVHLGVAVFPQWHPDWAAATKWIVALATAVAFFASILAHELAHALVARTQGVDVRRVTLFIFGGIAHLGGEPPTARVEFLIAIVGPLTSFVIGGLSILAASASVPAELAVSVDDPAAVLAALGPVTTVFAWLGPINILLGIFNLVPGFPLDGGRVLRAILWGATGNMEKATRWATRSGMVIGWGLIGCGVAMAFGVALPFFGVGLLPGVWLILIGWFLSNAARTSYAQVTMRRALEGVQVQDMMRAPTESVTSDLPVSLLVRDHILPTEQRAFPVTDHGTLIGAVWEEDLRRVARDRWEESTVADIMTDADHLEVLEPADSATEGLDLLDHSHRDQLLVVDHGRVRGLFQRKDALRWLSLYGTDGNRDRPG